MIHQHNGHSKNSSSSKVSNQQTVVTPPTQPPLETINHEVSQWIRQNPVLGIGIALAVGLGLGILVKRSL